jgi:outer membrane protein assembly factor BamB/tRNA A-37 threonylcarbamoyl transferase component Bud32
MPLLKKRNELATRSVEPQPMSTMLQGLGAQDHGDDYRTLGLQSAAKSTMSRMGDAQSPIPTSVLPEGTVLQERYVVEAVHGIGGMSIVYRGRDLRFKDVVRACAIKEMHQTTLDSQTRLLKLKNFEREASLLAMLSHPAIPKVYDFFEEYGRVYLVMELIDGQDLHTEVDATGGPLDEDRVGRWALEICDVLDFLHHQQPNPVIFRDLKPSNIIVTPQERIVLIDFGIARSLDQHQARGTVIGTEGYAPPEQYRGVFDVQGDIYALGATLHHLLTGVDPRLETPFTFHERSIRQANPAISVEIETAVMRMLEYEPSARPSSMMEVKALLQAVPGLGDVETAAADVPVKKIRSRAASGTKLLWKVVCGDEVRSSPCVRDGALYVGSYDTHLYCLDMETGKTRWKRATLRGISSSPAIWGDIVVVGSEDGQIYALDARRGSVRWTFRTDRPVRSSPRVSDRIIYVGSDDQHIYALDGMNGRVLWRYRTWMSVRSSCAVGKETVFVGSSDGHVYAIDALKGNLRWKYRTQKEVVSTPLLVDGMVYVGSMDTNVYALDTEVGSPVWRFKTGHYVNSSPVLDGKRIFVGGVDGCLYALEAASGKLVWKYETKTQITSSPRVVDGYVYFGAVDGNVYKLETSNGTLVWKYPTGGPVVSSPVVYQDKLFVGSMDRSVYALEA